MGTSCNLETNHNSKGCNSSHSPLLSKLALRTKDRESVENLLPNTHGEVELCSAVDSGSHKNSPFQLQGHHGLTAQAQAPWVHTQDCAQSCFLGAAGSQ